MFFYTGLREGELLALQFKDIDTDNRTITINKTFKHLNGQDLVTTPKTKSSNRTLSITENLAENLKSFFDAFPPHNPDDRIFDSLNVSKLCKPIIFTQTTSSEFDDLWK